MASMYEDLRSSATWMAEALYSSGYTADFRPSSLWQVERFFDEQSSGGRARPGGLLSEDLGSRVFGLGAYVGEVLRRSLGGDWVTDDEDPQNEVNVELRLPDGSAIWPMQRVMKRYQNGPDDSLIPYAMVLGLDVGARPDTPTSQPPKRRFFRRGS